MIDEPTMFSMMFFLYFAVLGLVVWVAKSVRDFWRDWRAGKCDAWGPGGPEPD